MRKENRQECDQSGSESGSGVIGGKEWNVRGVRKSNDDE